MNNTRRTRRREGIMDVVRKETCTHCKGNRYVTIKVKDGRDAHVKCPHCAGQGYRVRLR